MPYEFLLLDVADRVATVTINRPDKLNALNHNLMQELGEMIDELSSRADIGAVVLTGSGRAFVAGADISGLAQAKPGELERFARTGQLLFRRIEQLAKPIIAAVNGFALGGGFELALACHVRIASSEAKFGLPEVKLGLIPGYGGTQRLPRLIGRGRALVPGSQDRRRRGLGVTGPRRRPLSKNAGSDFMTNSHNLVGIRSSSCDNGAEDVTGRFHGSVSYSGIIVGAGSTTTSISSAPYFSARKRSRKR